MVQGESKVKFNAVEGTNSPTFVDIEQIRPGSLFETRDGINGVRVNDGYVLLNNSFGHGSAAVRSPVPGEHAKLPPLSARLLPKGTTFTITQD